MTNKSADLAANKRAYHDYEILETFEAGIVLTGTEIKSVREHGTSLQESYIKMIRGEAWLVGASIAPYKYGNINNHEEKRNRKLLLHRRELARLEKQSQEKGFTLIPLAFYLKNGRVKVKIGIGKGKKAFDKREDLKEKDEKRKMAQALKKFSKND